MPDRLTRVELEIMDVVWACGEATVQDVCDRLKRDLAYSSVLTTLRILVQKRDVLERHKVGRAYVYRPKVTREEISRTLLGDLREHLFAGSMKSLVLNLLDDDSISPSDIRELRSALEKLENAE